MEHDRYQENKALFIIGLISLIATVVLFAFSIYILPAMMWGWHYNIPEQLFIWREQLKTYYQISELYAGVILFLSFFVPALLMGFISYWTSNKIDNQIYRSELYQPERMPGYSAGSEESLGLGLKIFILALLVIAGVLFMEWLITSPTPAV